MHGYFRFTEGAVGQVSRFCSLFGLEIARAAAGDHLTFADLVDAPNYSLPGGTFLGAATTELFEGEPWEVMRANGLVYNFQTGLVVPITEIDQVVSIAAAGFVFLASGMILPGSVTDDGSRVTDYAAFFDPSRQGFKYSEVAYDG
jgi:hypothetical protein